MATKPKKPIVEGEIGDTFDVPAEDTIGLLIRLGDIALDIRRKGVTDQHQRLLEDIAGILLQTRGWRAQARGGAHPADKLDYSDLVEQLRTGMSKADAAAALDKIPSGLRAEPDLQKDMQAQLETQGWVQYPWIWGRAYERWHSAEVARRWAAPPEDVGNNLAIAAEVAIVAFDAWSAQLTVAAPELTRALGQLQTEPGWQDRLRSKAARLHEIGRPSDEPLPPWEHTDEPLDRQERAAIKCMLEAVHPDGPPTAKALLRAARRLWDEAKYLRDLIEHLQRQLRIKSGRRPTRVDDPADETNVQLQRIATVLERAAGVQELLQGLGPSVPVGARKLPAAKEWADPCPGCGCRLLLTAGDGTESCPGCGADRSTPEPEVVRLNGAMRRAVEELQVPNGGDDG